MGCFDPILTFLDLQNFKIRSDKFYVSTTNIQKLTQVGLNGSSFKQDFLSLSFTNENKISILKL